MEEPRDHIRKADRASCNVRLARMYITYSLLLAVGVIWLIAVLR